MYRPFEGRRRVTIIDQADALVTRAQNALLKTLEEPLPASVFVLVTSRPDTLLPTVRSRCAHLRFGRLQVAEVAAVLERSQGYSHADALTAAAASDGSVRRALDLEADAFADARSDAEGLLQVAGRDPRTRLEQAKELVERRRHARCRARASGRAADGDDRARCAMPGLSQAAPMRGCSRTSIGGRSLDALARTLRRRSHRAHICGGDTRRRTRSSAT